MSLPRGQVVANQGQPVGDILQPGAAGSGSDIITDTATHPGPYDHVVALAATVIASFASTEILGTDDATSPAAIPLPAGVAIHGRITNLTLTSGTVIAYKAV